MAKRRRNADREQACRRLRDAVNAGKIVKPDRCEECGGFPEVERTDRAATHRRGVVPDFPEGMENWHKPLWLCYRCLSLRRPGKSDCVGYNRPAYSPPYEELKRLIIDEGYSYRQVAVMCGLRSVPSLQQTFKQRAMRRGEWPFPGLYGRHNARASREGALKRRIHRDAATIPVAGMAAEWITLMRRTRIGTRDIEAVSGVHRHELSRIFGGERKRVKFYRYEQLDRALTQMSAQYADYEERLENARLRLHDRMEFRSVGLEPPATAAACGWRAIRSVRDGRSIHPSILQRIEDMLAKWEAEDGVLANAS